MDALVIGLGNDIKRDDVVGLRVTEGIEAQFPDLDVEFRTFTSGRIMLIDEIKGYDKVFVVDSIKTEGGTPGDWYRFTPAEVESGSGVFATHNVSLGTLTTLGESIGEKMPEIVIFAIEVEDPFEFAEGMTEHVERAVPELISAIGDAIRDELA